jgi:hypothetical protein
MKIAKYHNLVGCKINQITITLVIHRGTVEAYIVDDKLNPIFFIIGNIIT